MPWAFVYVGLRPEAVEGYLLAGFFQTSNARNTKNLPWNP